MSAEPAVGRIALEKIAAQKPSYEAASTRGSFELMRCCHCGYAWRPSAEPSHAQDCAYVDALDALAVMNEKG